MATATGVLRCNSDARARLLISQETRVAAMRTPAAHVTGMHDVTTYLWAFDGAPTTPERERGWIALPDHDTAYTPRARVALGRATSPWVTIAVGEGTFAMDGVFECASATRVARFDASLALGYYARVCARRVASWWQPTSAVTEFLESGDPDLRARAHHAAWCTSSELTGAARLAARAAMYAALPDRIVLAARQASSLTIQIASAWGTETMNAAHECEQRMLSSSLLSFAQLAARVAA